MKSQIPNPKGKSQTCHSAGKSQTRPPEAGPKSQGEISNPKSQKKRIAVIGPSNIERVAGAAGVRAALIREKAAEAGRLLAAAGLELVVVPDQGVPVIAAQAYRNAGGAKIFGLIPRSGCSAKGATSRVQRNSRLCDETRSDLTWLEQHARIVELADALICVGLSCGTICEIAWTKWMKKIPVFVLRGLNSGIPPEIEAETDLRYFDSLDGIIAALERPK